MTVWEAIGEAEAARPGRAAPDEEIDPRWQAIYQELLASSEQSRKDEWVFTVRWGCHADEGSADREFRAVL